MKNNEFITEDYEQRIKNDEIRMKIIRLLMDIYDTESLEVIYSFSRNLNYYELLKHPEKITDIAEELEPKYLVRLLGELKNMDMKVRAVKQMYDAFSIALDNYIDVDEEVENEN